MLTIELCKYALKLQKTSILQCWARNNSNSVKGPNLLFLFKQLQFQGASAIEALHNVQTCSQSHTGDFVGHSNRSCDWRKNV